MTVGKLKEIIADMEHQGLTDESQLYAEVTFSRGTLMSPSFYPKFEMDDENWLVVKIEI